MEKNLITSCGTESYSMTPRALLYIALTTELNGDPTELMEVFGGLGELEDNFENIEVFFPKIDKLVENLMKKEDNNDESANTN